MALSGSFVTSAWTSADGDKSRLLFEWSATQSIDGNSSTISWVLKGSVTNSSYVKAGGFKVVIDGETVYSKSTDYRISLYNGTVVASGTKTITHKNDGSRSFSVYVEGGLYYYAVNCTGSCSFDLNTIPRASAISCTKANIESVAQIVISRASSSFTHTVSYRFGGLSGIIAERTTATSIGWTIPDSFYGQIPNAKEGWGMLTCITYNGNTEVGTIECTFEVGTDESKCKPTIIGFVRDVNQYTKKLTGDQMVLIRYCSTAQCQLLAEPNKEAGSIDLKTINNIPISDTTLDFPNVETSVFDFYAKDSRGYYNTDKVAIRQEKFIPYIPITCDATIQRDTPTGNTATLTIEGNYFDDTFGAYPNYLNVVYKQGDGEYIPVTPNISNNKYKATVHLSELDYTKSFSFEVFVNDAISPITKPITLQKGIPVFDWGEDDFNFNVPVTINGVNILEKLAELESRIS